MGVATEAWGEPPSQQEQNSAETTQSSTPEPDQSDGKTADSPTQAESNDRVYVVQPGDTLSQIAEQLGTSVDYLASYNGIPDPNIIYSGQALSFKRHDSLSDGTGALCEGGNPDATSCGVADRDSAEVEEEDDPGAAAKLRFLQDSDEKGNIPLNAKVKAAQHAKKMQNKPMPGAATSALESAANIDRGSWTWMGPGNVGGRVRSLVIHPTDPQTMWAGSVGGGIWKTTDGGASWNVLDDFMANLAVSTMVIDPTDPNVLYAGTGEGFYNQDAIQGAGIFKTTDGGTTWNQLSSTATPDFQFVNRLAISPTDNQVLLAATKTGIWRSQDGGNTWTQTLAPGGAFPDLLQVAFDPSDGNNTVASGNSVQAYYSTDGGLNWIGASGLPASADGETGGRAEVAYAPSNPAIVYLALDNHKGQIYQSTDGGQNYSLVNDNGDSWLGDQGWYANTIWVDPTNPDNLVVGGLDLWRSTDGGSTLTKISDWTCGGFLSTLQCGGNLSAHADQHAIVSSSAYNGTTNKTVFIGDDGGLYKAQDISTVAQTSGWQELNNNFGVTQFFGGAGNTTSNVVVGGAQDNGSLTDTGNPQGWGQMFGGDGGFSAADPNDQNYFYGEYVYLKVHRSTNGGSSSDYIYNGITDAGSNALFIAPFILDSNDPNTMLAGGQSLWRSTNVKAGTPDWSSIKGPIGSSYPDNISAIAVAPGNSDIIWVGHANGDIYKTTNGTSSSPTWTRMDQGTPNLPDRYVGRITIDPHDSNKVYATFGGYRPDNVYETTDGGSTWSDITGSGATGLPDAPVRSLVVHPDNSNWLYVGTEVGIFASEDGGATWSLPTDGPANVSVDELFWMDKKLVAVTHGRGMFVADTTTANKPPVANADTYSTNQDQTLDVTAASGVLANDTDPAGNPLTAVKATDPASGTLTLNADGSFTYTPNAGFNGTDSFTYKANNGTTDSSAATVTITVKAASNQPPQAQDDSYSTDQDQTLDVSAANGVLANDTDPAGNPLTVSVLDSDTANGTLQLFTDGSFTYTPDAGFSGTDSFTYKANNGTTDSNAATVQININSVTQPPTFTTVCSHKHKHHHGKHKHKKKKCKIVALP